MKKILLLIVLSIAISSYTARELPCNRDLLKVSKTVLISQLGTREATNRNDGVQVEKYLASVGLGVGNPYCAAIQYYCFSEAARKLNIAQSEIPIIKTGSSQKLYDWAEKVGKKSSINPKPNDIIVWRDGKSYSGHVARVMAVGRGGWVTTIEGNTTSGEKGNQREGGGVYEKQRNLFHPLGRMKVRGLIHFKEK